VCYGAFGLSQVSFAFAQSARLSALENSVETLVESVRPIPEELASTGKCNFSSSDVARLVGRTFIISVSANLHSAILDEPDFFWENEEYLGMYVVLWLLFLCV
jgi:uncharacterized Rmd1/YagE family protein